MHGKLAAIPAVAFPVAIVAGLELAAVLRSAGERRPYVVGPAGAAVATEVVIALVLGLMAALVLHRVRPRVRPMALTALGMGCVLACGALFLLANGAPPVFVARATPASVAIPVAILVGALGGALRWRLASGTPPAAALACESTLAAVGFFESLHVQRVLGVAPTSALGLGILTAGLALAVFTGLVLERASIGIAERPLAWILTGTPFAVVAVAGCLAATGRAPFPEARRRAGPLPDVLLVVLDTTRADFAPAPAGSPYPTPTLDRLAREGTRWTNAYATSCWTVPSHASIFTGLLPVEHGAGWESPSLPQGVDTLAEEFRRRGYRTAAYSANAWISPEFDFDQGFERFETVSSVDRPFRPWSLAFVRPLRRRFDSAFAFRDKGGLTLASDATRFLGAADARPAFVFLNLIESHLRYDPPARFLADPENRGWSSPSLLAIDQDPLRGLLPETRPSAREIEGLRMLYAASIAYDDFLLGRLLQRLRAAGRLDDTLIVVVGDHGENLGEHDPLDHQLGLWDTLLHVPLLVRFPREVAAGRREDALVSVADVRRAILRLSGMAPEVPAGALFRSPERDAVFFSYDRPVEPLLTIRRRLHVDPAPWDRRLTGVRTRDAALIEGTDHSLQAYDLVRDPGETVNLAAGGSAPAALAALAGRLHAMTAAVHAATPGSRRPMSDDARRQLHSLGYVN